MSSVFSSAVSGLNAAIDRVSCVAANIANAASHGPLATSYAPKDVVAQTTATGEVRTHIIERTQNAAEQSLLAESTVDVASEIVQAMIAETSYKASAKVIGIEKKRQDSLLDTMA